MNIREIRQKYPQYDDMSDKQLADSMYSKHYSDMPRAEFDLKIGLRKTPTIDESFEQANKNLSDMGMGGPSLFMRSIGTKVPEGVGVYDDQIDREAVKDMSVGERALYGGAGALSEGLGILAPPLKDMTQEFFADSGVKGFRSPKTDAEKYGRVSSGEGAPAAVRAQISFRGGKGIFGKNYDPKKEYAAYSTALRGHYGKDTDLKRDGKTGLLTFVNPDSGNREFVNPVGFQWGDVASMSGEAVQGGTEIGGAALGAVLGTGSGGPGPGTAVGAIGGQIAGAAGGEYLRQKIGEKFFNLGENENILPEIAERSGLSLVGDAVAFGGKKTADFVGDRVANTKARLMGEAPNTAQKKALARNLQDYGDNARENAARIRALNEISRNTANAQPTVGQISGSDVILTEEDKLLTQGRLGQPVIDATAQNQQAINETGQEIFGRFGPNEGASNFGQQVDDVVGQKYRDELAAIDDAATKRGFELEDAVQRVAGDAAPREGAGVGMRTMLGDLYQQQQRKTDAAWEDLRATPGFDDVEFTPDEFSRVVGRQKAQADRSLVRGDIPEDISATEASARALDPGDPTDTGLIWDGPTPPGYSVQGGRAVRDPEPVTRTLTEAMSDESALGSASRAANTGAANRSAGQIGAKKGALSRDVRNAIERTDNAELLSKHNNARSARVEQRDLFESGVIGKVLKTNKSGEYSVSDQKVMEELLVPQTQGNPHQFLDLLDEFGSPQQKRAVRSALADIYQDAVSGETSGAIKSQHRRFMNKYGEAVRRLYGDDAEVFDNVFELARRNQMEAKKVKLDTKRLNKSGLGMIGQMDNDKVLGQLVGSPNGKDLPFDKVRAFRSVVEEENPELWGHFQSLVARDMSSAVMGKVGKYKDKVFSAKKLDAYLTEDRIIYLREFMGDQYVDDLLTFRDGIEVLQKEFVRSAETAAIEGKRAFRQSVRTAVAPPLSRRGRAYTAAITASDRHQNRMLASALADVGGVARLAALVSAPPGSKAAIRAAESLGLYHAGTGYDDYARETQE